MRGAEYAPGLDHWARSSLLYLNGEYFDGDIPVRPLRVATRWSDRGSASRWIDATVAVGILSLFPACGPLYPHPVVIFSKDLRHSGNGSDMRQPRAAVSIRESVIEGGGDDGKGGVRPTRQLPPVPAVSTRDTIPLAAARWNPKVHWVGHVGPCLAP